MSTASWRKQAIWSSPARKNASRFEVAIVTLGATSYFDMAMRGRLLLTAFAQNLMQCDAVDTEAARGLG